MGKKFIIEVCDKQTCEKSDLVYSHNAERPFIDMVYRFSILSMTPYEEQDESAAEQRGDEQDGGAE